MRQSRYLWALSILLALFGFGIAILGAYLTATGVFEGLYCVIIEPLIVGLAGLISTVAYKFEAGGK